jgi:hypothetical protein
MGYETPEKEQMRIRERMEMKEKIRRGREIKPLESHVQPKKQRTRSQVERTFNPRKRRGVPKAEESNLSLRVLGSRRMKRYVKY